MRKQAYFVSKTWQLLLAPTLSLLFLGAIIWLQFPTLKEKEQTISTEGYLQQQEEKRIRLDFLEKIPSFGFGNLIADWAFLDFIQYYGDTSAREKTGYGLSPEYFDLIVKKDPRFITAYLYLSPATSLFAGRPDKSVAITTEGLKSISPQMPLSYQVWSYKAIDQLLFLGDTSGARKSYEMAAEWAKLQATKETQQEAQQFTESAQFLAKNPDSKLARAGAWMMILGNARDNPTRRIALNNLKELGAEVTIINNTISVKMPQKD